MTVTAVAPDASWTLAPGPLVLLAAVLGAYLVRWRTVRREDGPRAAPTGRLALFVGGWLCAFAAIVSPIDRLAEQVLTMHMVQHLLLLDLAPVLCILGLTKVILRPVTRRLHGVERRAGRLAHPAVAVLLYAGVMWGWHVPAAYDGALEHPGLHALEHLTMTAAGGLYWWYLLSPIRARLRLGGMGPLIYMASTKLLVGILGIALAFAPDAFYAFYERGPAVWGLSPGEDQAVAGLVMALEQTIVMGIALAWLVSRMLGESEREEARAERYAA